MQMKSTLPKKIPTLYCLNINLNRFGCSPKWFYALNNCDALFAAFPEAQKCRTDIRGVDLPAYRNFSGKLHMTCFFNLVLKGPLAVGEALVNAKINEFRAVCSSRDMNTQVDLLQPTEIQVSYYHTVTSIFKPATSIGCILRVNLYLLLPDMTVHRQRICGCGFPIGGPKTSRTYHTVYR